MEGRLLSAWLLIVIGCISTSHIGDHVHIALALNMAAATKDGGADSAGLPYYPAIFVFGDSLSDSGNNNNLVTIAKANRPPYGRDFPTHLPTGRFSNGLIGPDYLAELAGLPFIPPYLSAGDEILQGVSFASGGSGILNSSGDVFGQHLAMSQQVTLFGEVKAALEERLGAQAAGRLINKALFYISIGSNDYLVNYLLTNGRFSSPLQAQYSPSQFLLLLQSNFEERLLELYNMGARKVAVVGLSLLGCVPMQLLVRQSKNGQCIDSINKLSQDYNTALLLRLQHLQKTACQDAHFTYLNAYDFLERILQNPGNYGFVNVNMGCCGSGRYNGLPTCILRELSTECLDASKYVFWDFVHPTSAIDKIAIETFWAGSFPDVNPVNLKQLALS